MKYPLYMFSDESGDLAQQDGRFVIFGVVVTPQVKVLRDVVKRTKQRYPKETRSKPYLHAADDPPKVTRYLLDVLSNQSDVSVGVLVFNREVWINQSQPVDDLYQQLMGQALQFSLPGSSMESSLAANIHVVVENRYKTPRQRERLIKTISAQTGIATGNILSEKKTHSQWGPALQIADAIAWSWYQKVEKEDDSFVNVLINRLPVNEVVLGVDGAGVIRTAKEIRGY